MPTTSGRYGATKQVNANNNASSGDEGGIPCCHEVTGIARGDEGGIPCRHEVTGIARADPEANNRIRERAIELEQLNCALQAEVARHQQVEEALRCAEEQYRNIFEHAVEGIFQTTPEGRYLKANPMLARIYGYASPEDLVAAMTDIAHQLYVEPNRRAEFMRLLQENDSVWNFESKVYRRDGAIIWISENARAMRQSDGRFIGYEGTVVDITVRKRTEEELARARRREIDIGSRIQQSLLLGHPPCDLSWATVAALTVPSQQIDGDFYDFLSHHDRCFDVVVGDVMGKGVPAALLSAAIKSSILHAFSRLLYVSGQARLPEPEEIVNRAHAEIIGQFLALNVFATLCYMRFDMEKRQVVLVDCGHTKTIHYQCEANACRMLEGENMPLGCNEAEVYRQVIVPFKPGDLFLFYSDGVTEARNGNGEFFDTYRILELIGESGSLPPEQLVARIHEAIIAHTGTPTFTDDLTCVAVRIEPQ
jgi:PAS domain S-box-containing protein